MALPFTGVKVRIGARGPVYWTVSNPLPTETLPWYAPWSPDLGVPDWRSFAGLGFYPQGRTPVSAAPVLWFGAGFEVLEAPDPENWPEPPLTSIVWGYTDEHPTVSKLRWGWLDPEGVRHEDSVFIPRYSWPVTPEMEGSRGVGFLVDLEISELAYDSEAETWSARLDAWLPYFGTTAPRYWEYQIPPGVEPTTHKLLSGERLTDMSLARFPRVLGLTSTYRAAVSPSGRVTYPGGTIHSFTVDSSIAGYARTYDGTDGDLSTWPTPNADWSFAQHTPYADVTAGQSAHLCGMAGTPLRRLKPVKPLWGYQGLPAPYYQAYYDEPDYLPNEGENDARTYEGRLAWLLTQWEVRQPPPVPPVYPFFMPESGYCFADAEDVTPIRWPVTREMAWINPGQTIACSDGVLRYGFYLPSTSGDTVALFTDPTGTVWNVSLEGDIIWVKHMQTDWKTWSSPLIVDSTGQYDSVAITGNGRVLYVNARRSTDELTFTFYSLDYGKTWDGPHLVGKDVT